MTTQMDTRIPSLVLSSMETSLTLSSSLPLHLVLFLSSLFRSLTLSFFSFSHRLFQLFSSPCSLCPGHTFFFISFQLPCFQQCSCISRYTPRYSTSLFDETVFVGILRSLLSISCRHAFPLSLSSSSFSLETTDSPGTFFGGGVSSSLCAKDPPLKVLFSLSLSLYHDSTRRRL